MFKAFKYFNLHTKKCRLTLPHRERILTSVVGLVGWSVCHNLPGRGVTLPCSFRSICLIMEKLYLENAIKSIVSLITEAYIIEYTYMNFEHPAFRDLILIPSIWNIIIKSSPHPLFIYLHFILSSLIDFI